MHKLSKIMYPSGVAIIGASQKEGSVGSELLKRILEFNYKGKVFPVNPSYTKLYNLNCYNSVSDIAEKVFGSSEPDKVQEQVKDWDTFAKAADTLKAAGYQAMASAIINSNVESIHCEAKNSVGGIYESGTWIAPVEPTPEPTTDTTDEVTA